MWLVQNTSLSDCTVIDAQSQGCNWPTRGVRFKQPFLSCARRLLGLSDPVAGRPLLSCLPPLAATSVLKKKKASLEWFFVPFLSSSDWPGNTREVAAGAAQSRGNNTGHRTAETGTAVCGRAIWTEQDCWWLTAEAAAADQFVSIRGRREKGRTKKKCLQWP